MLLRTRILHPVLTPQIQTRTLIRRHLQRPRGMRASVAGIEAAQRLQDAAVPSRRRHPHAPLLPLGTGIEVDETRHPIDLVMAGIDRPTDEIARVTVKDP